MLCYVRKDAKVIKEQECSLLTRVADVRPQYFRYDNTILLLVVLQQAADDTSGCTHRGVQHVHILCLQHTVKHHIYKLSVGKYHPKHIMEICNNWYKE